MTCGTEDCIDRVAIRSGEVASFEETIDAPGLRRMHGVEFVLVAGLLGEDFFSAFEGFLEGRFQLRVPGDLTPDVVGSRPGF